MNQTLFNWLVAITFWLVAVVMLLVWKAIRQLQHRVAHLERIARQGRVTVTSTGGGGGAASSFKTTGGLVTGGPVRKGRPYVAGEADVHIAMKGGDAGTPDGPGKPGWVHISEVDAGGNVRQVWPKDDDDGLPPTPYHRQHAADPDHLCGERCRWPGSAGRPWPRPDLPKP
jgi:hypothetical protein